MYEIILQHATNKVNGMLAYVESTSSQPAVRVGAVSGKLGTKVKSDCGGPTVTHKDDSNKDNVSFLWQSPVSGESDWMTDACLDRKYHMPQSTHTDRHTRTKLRKPFVRSCCHCKIDRHCMQLRSASASSSDISSNHRIQISCNCLTRRPRQKSKLCMSCHSCR